MLTLKRPMWKILIAETGNVSEYIDKPSFRNTVSPATLCLGHYSLRRTALPVRVEILTHAIERVLEERTRFVECMCQGDKTVVVTSRGKISEFPIELGLHEWSALNPLLFIIVMDVLGQSAMKAVLRELLYTNDLVIVAKRWGIVHKVCHAQVGAVSGEAVRAVWDVVLIVT